MTPRIDLKSEEGAKLLGTIARAGPAFVANELNFITTLWRRELVKHVPVDRSMYRNNISIERATIKNPIITAAVGTNVKGEKGFNYPAALEFGWGNIAGGRVARWKPGDPPILDWPAKRKDASKHTVVSKSASGQGRNTRGQFASVAATNSAEFMPPMRASWQLILPQVLQRLRVRAENLFNKGLT